MAEKKNLPIHMCINNPELKTDLQSETNPNKIENETRVERPNAHTPFANQLKQPSPRKYRDTILYFPYSGILFGYERCKLGPLTSPAPCDT